MLDITDPRVTPEPNSGCWLWIGAVHSRGDYGKVIRRVGGKNSHIPAHRQAWEDNRGPIPRGLWVLHKCDVGLCVNPDHLYLGTGVDNIRDRVARNRTSKGDKHYTGERRGERHHNAKLTDADVAAIRADTRPIKVIAEDYPVGWRWIEKLRTRNGTRR